jgi:hypothetical protein
MAINFVNFGNLPRYNAAACCKVVQVQQERAVADGCIRVSYRPS